MTSDEVTEPPTTAMRTVARLALSGVLVLAGLGHLFWAREDFQAQVPRSIPLDPDAVVMASGGVEIMLGAGLAVLTHDRVEDRTDHRRVLHRSVPGKHRPVPQQAERIRPQHRPSSVHPPAVSARPQCLGTLVNRHSDGTTVDQSLRGLP